MTTGNPNDAPMPLLAACLLAAFLVACGVWLILTGFHPRWRRTVHWGRMQKGPPVSLAGHIVGAAFATSGAVLLVALSIQISAFSHFSQVVAGITSTALIAVMIRDFLVWK